VTSNSNSWVAHALAIELRPEGPGAGPWRSRRWQPEGLLVETRVSVSKVKVGDTFTNTYAQKANQL
jgi:hypothetical protein